MKISQNLAKMNSGPLKFSSAVSTFICFFEVIFIAPFSGLFVSPFFLFCFVHGVEHNSTRRQSVNVGSSTARVCQKQSNDQKVGKSSQPNSEERTKTLMILCTVSLTDLDLCSEKIIFKPITCPLLKGASFFSRQQGQ
jgi:hypothetical protein